MPVEVRDEQSRREDREREEHQQAGDQDVPGEDRHPEHRHARAAECDHGGDHVDAAEDRAQARNTQTDDPQVLPHAGRVEPVS